MVEVILTWDEGRKMCQRKRLKTRKHVCRMRIEVKALFVSYMPPFSVSSALHLSL